MKLHRLTAVIAAFLALASPAWGQARGNAQGLPGSGNSGYPSGSTVTSTAGTATTGGISINFGGVPTTQFAYICGFSVSPGSATAAITISITLSSVNGGNTFTWTVGAPVTAAGVTGSVLTQTFSPCLRTFATGNGATLTVGALGAGGVGQAANMWGYLE